MEIDIIFEPEQPIKVNFGEVKQISDGGYDQGYKEGYKNGYEVGKAEGNVVDNADAIIDRSLSGFYHNQNITTIGRYAFYQCADLTEIYAPNVTSIGQNAFTSCSSLSKINFPKADIIGSYAFLECNKIENAEFPLASIVYSNAFKDCKMLKKLDFKTIKNINAYAFQGCNSLNTLIVRTNEIVALANSNAFSNTDIASGDGYVYVPSVFVDGYKTATNWSKFASKIRAIENYPEITGG